MVKNLPGNAGDSRDGVRSLDGEDPLEKEMATHSSILAWKIPRTEEPGGLQSMGLQRVRHEHNTITAPFMTKVWDGFPNFSGCSQQTH